MNARPSVAAGARRQVLAGHFRDPLYRTGYLLIAGSGATAILGFVFWAVAARNYPAHEVGVSAAAISAMILLSGASQLGLNTLLVRYLPTAGTATRSLVLRSYGLAAALSLLVGTVAALASPSWAPSLSFLAHRPGWLIGFAVATACWTLFCLQDAVMTGLQAAGWVSIENSLFSVGKLLLLVPVAGVASLAGPFVAWNVPVVVAVVAITALIFTRLIPASRREPAPSLRARRFIRTAAGNYVGTLCGLGVMFLTPVVVTDVAGPTKTAYFYVPWTIELALLLVAYNTSTSLTLEAALDEAQLAQLLRRTLVHTIRLLVPLIAVATLGAPVLLRVFGADYEQAGTDLLRLLALSALPNTVVMLGIAVARIEQRAGALILIEAGSFVPLILLSIPLLHARGITGVGIASLATQTALAASLMLTILRRFLFNPS
jgi:O-antigen/teichoic acid export membrane protein